MKKIFRVPILFVWTVCIFMTSIVLGAPADKKIPDHLDLYGTIAGNIPVRMTLWFDGKDVWGSYYYQRVKQYIDMYGTIEGDVINMTERETQNEGAGNPHDNDTISGYFKGKLTSKYTYSGVWSDPTGKKHFPFSLQPVGPDSSGWSGSWKREDRGDESVFIYNVAPDSFMFGMRGQWHDRFHYLDGVAKRNGNVAVYQNGEEVVRFVLSGTKFALETKHFGTPMNIVYDGNYIRLKK